MKAKDDKEIDLFLRKAIKDLEYQELPSDFTTRLLEKIEESKVENSSLGYKPLISKPAWFTIALILIGLFFVMGRYGNFSSKGWWLSIKWNTVGNLNLLNSFPKFDFFNSTVYGFIGFALFILVQIIYLKYYFSNRDVII